MFVGSVVGGFIGGRTGASRKVKAAIRTEVRAALDAHESRCRFAAAAARHLSDPPQLTPSPLPLDR